MKANYMQVVHLNDKEKMKMYMRQPKRKLAEMLINANNVIDALGGMVTVSKTWRIRTTPKDV